MIGKLLCDECPEKTKKMCSRDLSMNFHDLDGEVCLLFWERIEIKNDCPYGKNCPCGKDIINCLKVNKISNSEFAEHMCGDCEFKNECSVVKTNTTSATDTNAEGPDVLGFLGKAAKIGFGLLAASAQAEANAPMHTWQCQYCGQIVNAKHRPKTNPCPMYFRAGSNASRITPHVWNRID